MSIFVGDGIVPLVSVDADEPSYETAKSFNLNAAPVFVKTNCETADADGSDD